ncbi:excinuclease ABC subunit UvrA [Paraburkholderia sp. SIMBA_055]|uniref:UvrABC system protein A n=1 Tax=Paraburkholderia graminis (strain ATCC 700544 / DSM 17151 / LMG 18924 / NCIMB 13744 / C4D1M) TaxID=396598 RepID=B1FWT9_PARG4|nr:excinuclease ABC subunit UvrA [Paraburkholderia graminis]ALE53607.1 excinuclease ABC subunit A [Burkholderia sp. HB1]AXF06807.1 excinuclease ABC subunit UvrA [Paraburkholderia graminis]EDT11846.1 excinuclease ABC, A subunit [Paraburkholderia graminis C4D1M]MDQ0621597.1 excinuclease ABC subunit A [Paraburkholderia graminis]MDR6469046.1 excinuclease ABC subunit A [Paraburkholderia graminis]
MEQIRIRGARTHNLKNVNLDLPRHKLVVITGLSGSGKSSLAFDTLYAEGQRRYVESLSAYARQFLQLMEKPDVDLIEGLSPAISIEQKATSHNPRSTVGTVTEIHDYLRLLFARVGTPYCPDHEIPLEAQSVSQMVDAALALPDETKLMILAPVVADRKGEHVELFEEMQAQGFIRFRVRSGGGTANEGAAKIYDVDSLPKLKKNDKHTIDVVVDRLKVRPDMKQRLAESFETALRLADGRAIALEMDTDKQHLFSSKFACPICSYSLQELEPRLFSFNNPMGACPECDGLGQITFFDPKRVVAHPSLSLAAGAVKGWDRRNQFYFQMLQSLAAFYDFDIDTAVEDLPEKVRKILLFGSGKQEIPFSYINERGRASVREHVFEGIIPNLERRYRETDSAAVREELAKYQNNQPCPACAGTRLRREARFVRIGADGDARGIYEISGWPLRDALGYFQTLRLEGSKREIADKVIKEIVARLMFLNNVGLDYLSLERSAETLSGGEAQRIRLASQIGSGLTGVMYVLDEPSIGLHQRDNDRLISTLKHLRDLGNSVIVVEHDEDMIRMADYVVDMGPGAGEHGGMVIAEGTPKQVQANAASMTGQYMSGARTIEYPDERKDPDERHLRIVEAHGNNLRHVTLDLPVGLLTCVTGVSGSGKSTLINDTLYQAVAHHLYGSSTEPAPYESIEGLEHFDKVINVDQSPIGRTPRSNPATYTGLFTPIRELFAGVPAAKERGYDPGRFSFNVKGGRCESCQGDGVLKVEMHFLPDVYVPCDVCHGKRYNRETLDVQYKGKNISEVLDMTVEHAYEFFRPVPVVARKLKTLLDVGLGYIRLGQSATTLSGGEAQRVKLSLELSKRDTGRTLYILDEPTTGLHFHDIALLLEVIHRLRDQGNTVVIIEHNLDVIKTADWVIDMGPEGGAGGGQIIAQGTPEQIAKSKASFTGRYLAPLLKRAASKK